MSRGPQVALVYAALGIVINLVGGTLVAMLHIPLLFLDTVGTVLVAVLFGPWWGAAAGGLTNVVQGFMTNPRDIPFALVNIAIGLIVGYVARRYDFRRWLVAASTGVVLAVVAPLIGTPIAVALYGGLTGGGTDLVTIWLYASGQSIFQAAFLSRVAGNLIDKVGTVLLVMVVLRKVPALGSYRGVGRAAVGAPPDEGAKTVET